jgi:hypothetical protein
MTPDTSAYYHAAYIVAGVIYVGYVVSLWWRARSARRGPPTETVP